MEVNGRKYVDLRDIQRVIAELAEQGKHSFVRTAGVRALRDDLNRIDGEVLR
jgi:hypothetical protein